MIGNSISLDGSSETSAESAQSIKSLIQVSDLSAAGLRPNPAGIGSEVRTREETIYSTLESQRQCMN